MPLTSGTRLGPYEILSSIGAGGMGEVYKATDTRLDRTVAIKVLPEHVASDPDLKQRFEREAKTISSLNHPHICTLHDIGSQDGIDFLVMEYLEGETLAQRLEKGALPLDQALKIAVEIADALDKAHRQGIVHRDLKPGNIMLTKAGAKLLDFGLAKLRPSGPVGVSAPTMSEGLTGEGAILGTLQYMAPEQLEGKEADHRTDIFAFGAVVYEMVTGQRAFSGESQASLIAAILEREPVPMSTLQTLAPAKLDEIVTTCLAKNPEDRWQSARDLGRETKRIVADGPQTGTALPAAGAPRQTTLRQALPWVLAVLAVVTVIAGTAVWNTTSPSPGAISRLSISPAIDAPLKLSVNLSDIAISPDGRHVAYVAVANGENLVQVRAVDQLVPRTVATGDNLFSPFFSSDGTWIGFQDFSDGFKKVSVDGGPVVPVESFVSAERGAAVSGAVWGPDDVIIGGVFGFVEETRGLWRFPASGGESEQLTIPQGGDLHINPDVIPGGGTVLFNIRNEDGRETLAVLSLSDRTVVSLDIEGKHPRFLSSGHLVYGFGGTLYAVGFDPERLVVTGSPIPVQEGVTMKTLGASFEFSRNGSFVYVPGSASGQGYVLAWADRDGNEELLPQVFSPALLRSGGGTEMAMSPTVASVAFTMVTDGQDDIWTYDIARDITEPLTTHPAQDRFPLWTSDEREVLFSSTRDGGEWGLFSKQANGTGDAVPLLRREGVEALRASAWTPDGRLIFRETTAETRSDLWMRSMDGETVPLIRTPFQETEPAVSPDGRWIAYASARTGVGQFEVYVDRFPDTGQFQRVSQAGGRSPSWSPNGRELMYVSVFGRQWTAVSFDPVTGEFGQEEPVLNGNYVGNNYGRDPSGQRLLVVKQAGAPTEVGARNDIILVQNWTDELQRLVPNP